MNLLRFKKFWYFLSLILLCLIIIASHSLYVFKTHQYPHEDEHVYLGQALNFYDVLVQKSSSKFDQIAEQIQNRQPIYPLILTAFFLIIGIDNPYKLALWVNSLFYITTIIAIYFLGKEFLSKKASFLAAFIFAFYGFPLFYLHFAYSETVTTTFVVLALLFLAKTKNFSIPKHAFWFSLFFAIGSLVRWVAPIFTLGPLLLVLFIAFIKQIRKKTRNIKNFCVNILIFFTIGILPALFLYYIPKFNFFREYVVSNIKNNPIWVAELSHLSPELQNTLSIRSIMFYFNIFSQQTIFFFLLFMVGFILSSFFLRKYIFFLIAFIIPWGIFTFGAVLKADRFIVPIYPVMALISAVTFDYLKNKALKTTLISLTIIIGSLNFLGASWGIGPMGRQGLKDVVLPKFIPHPRRIYLTPIVWPPRENYSNADVFVNTIQQDFDLRERSPIILLTFSYFPFENAVGSISLYEKRGEFVLQTIRNLNKTNYLTLFERIKKSDYLVVKDKEPVDGYIYGHYPYELYMYKVFNQALYHSEKLIPRAFMLIKTIQIPLDKTNLRIYKKTREITSREWKNIANILIQIDPNSKDNIMKAVSKIKSK